MGFGYRARLLEESIGSGGREAMGVVKLSQ